MQRVPERTPANSVVLAVTGSIAAYKACEVVRRLRDHDIEVRVAMTRNATEFVSPLTFAALTGHRVLVDGFDDRQPQRIAHVRWADLCGAFCVVPASADFIAKMAAGIADDFPSTLHLSIDCPVLVAPAMEDRMWRHPAVQDNVETLRRRGVRLVEPEVGSLASGRYGPGRLAEPEVVVEAILALLTQRHDLDLDGTRILVTAGPTYEFLDPVRVLTNPSSGKMGFELARAAARRGATVTLVSGPTQVPPPPSVEVVHVVTGDEMAAAVAARLGEADILVMAAAVTDFKPSSSSPEKLKKADVGSLSVDLVPTDDILAGLKSAPGDRVVVGFAAETSDVESHAREKLLRKGCDVIVGNRVGIAGSGFAADYNEVVILDRQGGRTTVDRATKSEVAERVWDAVVAFRRIAVEVATGKPE